MWVKLVSAIFLISNQFDYGTTKVLSVATETYIQISVL